MSLVLKRPTLLRNLFSDFDDFFTSDFLPSSMRMTVPPVNVKENEKEFVLEVAAPGMKKEDIKISVKEGMLTLTGEKEMKKEEKEEKYTRKEFSYTSFSRSFPLPENVDEDKIVATCKDGVLMVTLPKMPVAEKPKVKEIAVS